MHRIGGLETIHVEARVIAATNADLWRHVQEGSFREDLFYRINVFPIHLPPLRERPEDIPTLVDHFLRRFCRREGLPAKELGTTVGADLMARSWPGNIRELENAVELAVILSGSRRVLELADFPETHPPDSNSGEQLGCACQGVDYRTRVQQFEKDLITRALERANGNKTLAAEMLRLNRTTLVEKWKKLGLGDRPSSTAHDPRGILNATEGLRA